MTVFSVLRPSLQRKIGAAAVACLAKKPHQLLSSKNAVKILMVRTSVTDISPNMRVMPTKYMTNLFFDNLHFYYSLALIPMAIVIFCANVFIGQAEIQDIPEGYEPQEYEYIKGPIQRFFQRYCYDSYQKEYERNLFILNAHQEKRNFKMLEKKVKYLQSTRQDYKGWYYQPGPDLGKLEYIEKLKIRSKETGD